MGVTYYTVNWADSDKEIIFSETIKDLPKIIFKIESALQIGSSVLVHSLRGQCRSCCVVAGYLMQRYRWTLEKSLEFLHLKKNNVHIRQEFLLQLKNFEEALRRRSSVPFTNKWTGKKNFNI